VTQHLIQRVIQPDRLRELLGILSARREDQKRIAETRFEDIDAKRQDVEQALQRLYGMVESGLSEPDELLLQRIERLKLERSSYLAALERCKVARSDTAPITDIQLSNFAGFMKERLCSEEIPFRKAYLSALIDRIDVSAEAIQIIGRKSVLEHNVTSQNEGPPSVRSFVRKWRARKDSNL
jgi:site-specific DNA recombinase